MSDTPASLRRKIKTAGDLQSVVRTMKAVAASSIGQYEKSVSALGDYYRTVELGLGACFRQGNPDAIVPKDQRKDDSEPVGAIVFGSDQGLVGQFNEVIADFAIKALSAVPGKPTNKPPGKPHVWAVGERVRERLADAGIPPLKCFALPNSVQGITPLVGELQIESEAHRAKREYARLYVFHNRPKPGAAYEPVSQQLLPLDAEWLKGLVKVKWPTGTIPQVMGTGNVTLRALIREYLFISVFRACAESLASENASRLAAMQRADKNIDDSLETLNATFHRVRQAGIDEELFDVVAGFEALTSKGK